VVRKSRASTRTPDGYPASAQAALALHPADCVQLVQVF
jgi:hypothetical protein